MLNESRYDEEGRVVLLTDEEVREAFSKGVTPRDLAIMGLQGQATILAEAVQGIHLSVDVILEGDFEQMDPKEIKDWVESVHKIIETTSQGVADITEFVRDTGRRLNQLLVENPGVVPGPPEPTTGFYL